MIRAKGPPASTAPFAVLLTIGGIAVASDADPDRLAVTGYSYGGYMTNVVITRTNHAHDLSRRTR